MVLSCSSSEPCPLSFSFLPFRYPANLSVGRAARHRRSAEHTRCHFYFILFYSVRFSARSNSLRICSNYSSLGCGFHSSCVHSLQCSMFGQCQFKLCRLSSHGYFRCPMLNAQSFVFVRRPSGGVQRSWIRNNRCASLRHIQTARYDGNTHWLHTFLACLGCAGSNDRLFSMSVCCMLCTVSALSSHCVLLCSILCGAGNVIPQLQHTCALVAASLTDTYLRCTVPAVGLIDRLTDSIAFLAFCFAARLSNMLEHHMFASVCLSLNSSTVCLEASLVRPLFLSVP